MNEVVKKCSKCNEYKSLNEFAKDKHQDSGLTCACKCCLNTEHRDYYLKNKEKVNKIYNDIDQDDKYVNPFYLLKKYTNN